MKQDNEPAPRYSSLLWRVRLFDGPLLETPSGENIRRFRSQKVGALLAYLALRLGRSCPREELVAAIWPEENETRIVANRLRVALASLRRQLEPSGIPFGSVLDVSSAGRVCLREETVWCDVDAFERMYKAGQQKEAASLLMGTILPGYYEEWALAARARFDALSDQFAEDAEPEPIPENRLASFASLLNSETFPLPLYPLPLYLTRFFGREQETAHLLELLCNHRLVTLTGPGGMGKTRFAVETVKRRAMPTVFAALADVTENEQIPGAVLRALGALSAVDADLTEQLISIFRRRGPVLLLLDNAEHLIEPIAEWVMRLLASVPDLSLLVTSRQSLNIAGEIVAPLAPLSAPLPETPTALLVHTPTVALFLDRAKQARPDFMLTARYVDAITQICLLSEGTPLALELAAARVVMQTPAQIADSMAASLLRLQSQQHGLAARHRSLRASIQGSYDLLPPKLRTFFGGLSVFQGGWTMEAARFVTDCPETEAFLEDLARRSLLVVEENESRSGMRCRFLESIRQFAAELPGDSEREILALRHAQYYLTLAAEVSEDDIRSLIPLDAEQENLLTALAVGFRRQEKFFSAGLTGALYYAYIRGYNRLFLPWAERSVTLRPHLPDIKDRTRLGITLYLILGYAGRYELVRALGEEMQREADANHDAAESALAKLVLCYVALQPGDYETVMRLSSAALQEARQAKETPLLYRVLRLVAWLWRECAVRDAGMAAGDIRKLLLKSKALAEGCLSILPPHSSQITFTQSALSQVNFALGNAAAGYERLKSAQKTAIAHGMKVMLIFCYRMECEIAIEKAHFDYAALLYGAFRALCEETGLTAPQMSRDNEGYQSELERRLGNERFEALALQGEQTPHETMAGFSLNNLPSLSF